MIQKIPYSEYEKRHGINASLLKIAHSKSLAHVKAYMEGKRDESESMSFGTMFHSLMLEGREDFCVTPDSYTNSDGETKKWHGSSNTCKAWLKEQRDNGKQPVSNDEAWNLRGMSKKAPRFEGQAEVSIFIEKDGIPLKARIDVLNEEFPVDYKTCGSANPEKFVKDIINFGYHIQAAFYIDVLRLAGMPRNQFKFVAVECEPPFACSVITLRDEPISLLRLGRLHYREALNRILEAKKTNNWSDYGAHDAELFIPAWMRAEIERTA